jgi:hypothetical protein
MKFGVGGLYKKFSLRKCEFYENPYCRCEDVLAGAGFLGNKAAMLRGTVL